IQKIYHILEDRFYKLYKALIESGYHSKCWKEAIGVILKKQNRKATIPKSYKVISLLNCLGTVAEKIIATRLSFLAESTDLLDSDCKDSTTVLPLTLHLSVYSFRELFLRFAHLIM